MNAFRLSGFLRAVIVLCALGNAKAYAQVSPLLDETKPNNIMIVGDSLSAAFNMPVNQGWVSLLDQKISATHPEYAVVNTAISGATTAAGLSSINRALSLHQPRIVILALGANDGLQGKPISYISTNLSKLISLSQQAGAKVLLLGIRLPPNYGSRYAGPFFEQYSELAEKYNLALVPFLLEGVAGIPELMMADGLHPKAQAQPIILANVWPLLEPLL